jgi:hypothetical protein
VRDTNQVDQVAVSKRTDKNLRVVLHENNLLGKIAEYKINVVPNCSTIKFELLQLALKHRTEIKQVAASRFESLIFGLEFIVAV